jgi:hypothetical protein
LDFIRYIFVVISRRPEMHTLVSTHPWCKDFLRKCRLWQSLCVLTQGVSGDDVIEVSEKFAKKKGHLFH